MNSWRSLTSINFTEIGRGEITISRPLVSVVFRDIVVNHNININIFFLLQWRHWIMAGITLGRSSANERRRYIVIASLISWAHTQNAPELRPLCILAPGHLVITNSGKDSLCDAYLHQRTWSSLVPVMVCRQCGRQASIWNNTNLSATGTWWRILSMLSVITIKNINQTENILIGIKTAGVFSSLSAGPFTRPISENLR